MKIAENIRAVRERIAEAAAKAGRDPEEVTLVAVSKRKPVGDIREALEAGCLDFGENYVQELLAKMEEIPEGPRWHFIGRLQRNKAKLIVGRVKLFHALDSLKLAEALERRAAEAGVVVEALAEVNLGEEETKGGVAEEELWTLLEGLAPLENLRVRGLMGMPPYFPDPEESRPYYRRLRELAEEARRRGLAGGELSMGMSHDYAVAVEEGATLVRVGTAIFGER